MLLAETEIPGDTGNDCDAGPEEEHSEGRARCAAAFPHGDHGRCLHAGDSGQRASDGQFESPRIEGEVQAFDRRLQCRPSTESNRWKGAAKLYRVSPMECHKQSGLNLPDAPIGVGRATAVPMVR